MQSFCSHMISARCRTASRISSCSFSSIQCFLIRRPPCCRDLRRDTHGRGRNPSCSRESMNSISPALPFLLSYASVRRPRRLARYQSPLPNDFAPRAKHTLLTLRESPAAVHSSRFHRAQCQGPRQTAPRGRDGSHIYHRKDLRLLLRPCFPKACGAILVSDTFDNEHQRNGECCEIRGTGSLPTNTTVPLITGHPIRVGEWDAAWGDAVVVCYEDHQLTVPMKAASTWEPPEHRFQKKIFQDIIKVPVLE